MCVCVCVPRAMTHVAVPRLTPNARAPFCDVIYAWSILKQHCTPMRQSALQILQLKICKYSWEITETLAQIVCP